MKKWIIATRPWSFPASAMPAIATITFVGWKFGVDVNWLNGFLALLGAVFFQTAGNLIGDYYDFRYKVDRKESFGSSRMLVDGVFSPQTILNFGLVMLALGSAIGLLLLYRSGLHLLWIGVLGVLGTYFYYLFKYKALGDLTIFIIYGQLIALGTGYVMTNTLDWQILLVSVPIGFLVVNILHANNTRDIKHDGQAHIQTFAMLLGVERSRLYYMILALSSYLSVGCLVAFQQLPVLCLSVLLTLPIALKNIRLMKTAMVDQPENIKDLDASSAQLVMTFSLLFSGANVLTVCLL